MDYLKDVNLNIWMSKERKILVMNFMAKIMQCNHYLLELSLLKDFMQVQQYFHLKTFKIR